MDIQQVVYGLFHTSAHNSWVRYTPIATSTLRSELVRKMNEFPPASVVIRAQTWSLLSDWK